MHNSSISTMEQDESFVGHSVAFQSIMETIKTVAARESSVVIVGETGTGKEMVARQIHARSNRAATRYVLTDAFRSVPQMKVSLSICHGREPASVIMKSSAPGPDRVLPPPDPQTAPAIAPRSAATSAPPNPAAPSAPDEPLIP